MAENTAPRRPFRLAALAALAGLFAGLAVVYVTGWGSVHSAGGCSADPRLIEALKAASKGQLAGLVVADAPADLSQLAFQSADGKPASLADFNGKLALVNLWATWCVPCREEMPALDRLAAAEGGPDFTVVTINLDTGAPDKPRQFLDDIKATALPDYRDPKMKAFASLKTMGLAFGLPTSLIVDRKGCQLASLSGPAPWDGDKAKELVAALVAVR